MRRTPVAVLGLVALASAACGGGGGEETAATTSTTTSTVVSEGTIAPVAPLTGLPDDSSVVTSRPAASIKVDNAPKARPQGGLDVADIVFEEMVEGGTTRFIAVFHSATPDNVGPVRSVRPMDPNIVSALGGLVAYSGGIPEFVSLMRKATAVQDLNFDNLPSAYHREKGRSSPNNLFVNPAELWAKADATHSSPPQPQWPFRAAAEAFGEADAVSVRIPFSPRTVSGYEWDAAAGHWKRTQDGNPHMVISGKQITPTNVVVQFVQTHALRYRDQSGSAVMESIVVGEGEAWVLSGGRIAKGRWSKADANSITSYTDAAGAPVKMAPGSTWVHYVPVGNTVTVGAPAAG